MERKDNDLLDKYSDLQKTDSQQTQRMVNTNFDFIINAVNNGLEISCLKIFIISESNSKQYATRFNPLIK